MFSDHELRSISVLAERDQLLADSDLSRTPRVLRRLAEIAEILEGDDAAWPLWVEAAMGGDEPAAAYVEVLLEERNS